MQKGGCKVSGVQSFTKKVKFKLKGNANINNLLPFRQTKAPTIRATNAIIGLHMMDACPPLSNPARCNDDTE